MPLSQGSSSIPPYRTTVQSTDEVTPVEVDPLETAKWTNSIPEAFGLREAIRASSYRWCAREAGMWGIATGTAMTIHRLRMGSNTRFAVNVGMLAFMTVTGGSYYFCCRRRDHRERVVEAMMKLNAFEHASQMPSETPLEQHPFAKPGSALPDQEFRGLLKENKEWQPREVNKDMKDVFTEKRP
ncbi:expressed unknown protein [Seminavis robusta]|uniref:Cytochrome c oxidase assembly protein COX20, mitochondrial n=1 Tax=Seminavis robusta TaxID=568900 RepID=A0A9N8EMT9_9STRA|nr:expressed unknown protein [Seminavis robusta]|eukprot:Sro1355_g265490.1 n/a (184) ;mRNA; r:4094-4730